jgi:VanZ family protein
MLQWMRWILLIVLVGYWGFALTMTHIPRPPQIGQQFGDKTAHGVGYAALAGLLYLTLWAWKPAWRWTAAVVFAIVLAYGVIDERTQPLFGRTCDLRDWFADVAGAGVATGVCLLAQRGVWRIRR